MADKSEKKDKSYFDKPEQELPANFPIIKPVIKKSYYVKASWKGVQEIFKCSTCGGCRNIQDEIILHVLLHVPEGIEREELFIKLMEERL